MKALVNGFEMEYRIEGKAGAPWVTFSHSLACNLTMWDGQVDALQRNYRILRYDTRGHGGSEAVPGPYDFSMLSADVIALWNSLNISKSHFIGLSLGGMTGLGLGLDHEDRILSLCICNARADRSEGGQQAWAERVSAAREQGMDAIVDSSISRWFTRRAIEANLPVIDKARAMIRSTSIEGYSGGAAAIRQLDYLPQLGRISRPIFFVVGSEDPGTPPAAARAMQRAVSGAALLEIEGAAHLSNLERPEVFNPAIADFLSNADS